LSHADVLRAIARLKTKTDQRRRDVARLLGFEWKKADPAAPREPSPERQARTRTKRRRTRSLPPLVPQVTREAPPVDVSFELSGPEPGSKVQGVLPTGFPDFSGADVPPLEPLPLLVPRWTRAILSTALSAATASEEIDLPAAIDLLASGHPLRALPRRRAGRIAPAAQVLIDAGESMTPFLADQARLLADLAQVIGGSSLEMLKFVGTPLRNAGRGARRSWPVYSPPPPGTAIVLVTDLGIADTGFGQAAPDTAEWMRFLELLQLRGCPAIALVPYGPHRWPARIAHVLPIITWDRATTVRHARFGTAIA